MTFNRRNDPLLDAVRDIQEYCETHALHVFSGYLTREHETVAVWNVGRNRDWKVFVEVAVARAVGLIYLDWVTFEEFHVEDAMLRGEETPDAADPDPRVDEYNRNSMDSGLTPG